MEKKNYITATLLIGLFAIWATGFIVPSAPAGVSDSLQSAGLVCVELEKVGGKVDMGCFVNTVTNIAKNQTRNVRMYGNDSSGMPATDITWDYIQLSTGATAPDAADTQCEATRVTGNGLDIAQGAVSDEVLHVGNFTVYKKFQATGSQAGIVKICLHNGSSATGELMASSAVTSFDLENEENVSVRYYVGET